MIFNKGDKVKTSEKPYCYADSGEVMKSDEEKTTVYFNRRLHWGKIAILFNHKLEIDGGERYDKKKKDI